MERKERALGDERGVFFQRGGGGCCVNESDVSGLEIWHMLGEAHARARLGSARERRRCTFTYQVVFIFSFSSPTTSISSIQAATTPTP